MSEPKVTPIRPIFYTPPVVLSGCIERQDEFDAIIIIRRHKDGGGISLVRSTTDWQTAAACLAVLDAEVREMVEWQRRVDYGYEPKPWSPAGT